MASRHASLQDTLVITHDAVFRSVGGDGMVLNLATGIYFGLDATSARLWSLITELGSLQRVHDAMLAEFEVDAERLEGDLLRFADELVAADLAAFAAAA